MKIEYKMSCLNSIYIQLNGKSQWKYYDVEMLLVSRVPKTKLRVDGPLEGLRSSEKLLYSWLWSITVRGWTLRALGKCTCCGLVGSTRELAGAASRRSSSGMPWVPPAVMRDNVQRSEPGKFPWASLSRTFTGGQSCRCVVPSWPTLAVQSPAPRRPRLSMA